MDYTRTNSHDDAAAAAGEIAGAADMCRRGVCSHGRSLPAISLPRPLTRDVLRPLHTQL